MTALDDLVRPARYPRSAGYDPAWLLGWEAIAWHTAEWWRFPWEITELVKVTSARLQEHGWQDWLLWARACAEHQPDGQASNQSVLDMLTADGGEFLTFALVTARKHARLPHPIAS